MRILPACAWLIAAVVAGGAPPEEAAVGNEVRVVQLPSRAPAPEAFIPDRPCYRAVQETCDSAEALVSAHPGLDLNRSFTVGWGVNSGRSECARNYGGPRALSEPETEAVAGYAAEVFPNAWDVTTRGAAPSSTSGLHADFHVTARLVKFPWNYTGNRAPSSNGSAIIGYTVR
ncbi:MAG: M14 family zinc carboxypeptidase [Acidobacteriota bacterium]|nr:M14 family zinc carboxypeptidase [Acidobacteriota bacterium]